MAAQSIRIRSDSLSDRSPIRPAFLSLSLTPGPTALSESSRGHLPSSSFFLSFPTPATDPFPDSRRSPSVWSLPTPGYKAPALRTPLRPNAPCPTLSSCLNPSPESGTSTTSLPRPTPPRPSRAPPRPPTSSPRSHAPSCAPARALEPPEHQPRRPPEHRRRSRAPFARSRRPRASPTPSTSSLSSPASNGADPDAGDPPEPHPRRPRRLCLAGELPRRRTPLGENPPPLLTVGSGSNDPD